MQVLIRITSNTLAVRKEESDSCSVYASRIYVGHRPVREMLACFLLVHSCPSPESSPRSSPESRYCRYVPINKRMLRSHYSGYEKTALHKQTF